ncbi:ribosome biogenesis GTPase RsgA (plasmid) [Gemmatirosa kalamazoonensis]|uniref:Small ribosomal subunit biogenesis GTPase RsgA n=1 Tax=Gemmatirosa kalamazoonensis TaxID=861299 RepID=W0RPD8_9BACT|nr:ribosome small subunit-dependent GTPase A [Gemmatirosa kalamazoonensis]AHG92357.1 ribosome biogenesis GTPase RsgA [Gemmatirosa kalamazoonensis]
MPNDNPLASLGWDDEWRTHFAPFVNSLVPARVVAEHRSRYLVAGDGGERSAVVAGRLRHDDDTTDARPAVGDWVAVDAGPDGVAVIRAVLPRRTAFVRRAAGRAARPQVVAANVDVAAIVAPLSEPPNARWVERFVAVAWESGAVPLVVLTKADLCNDPEDAVAALRPSVPGVDVVAVSASAGTLDPLRAHLVPGRTLVLLGKSGAGKSTLVNALLGHERMATRDVRDDGKGRHTTTHRELVPLDGGALLVDTPGMRELALWGGDGGVEATYADVEALADECRFRDCAHDGEPGCAVADAVAAGTLGTDRLASWRKLRRELAHLARRDDPRAAAEVRARTKVIMRNVTRLYRERGR